MLNVFTLANGRLDQQDIQIPAPPGTSRPVWVDLDAPTPEEEAWVAQHFGLRLPKDAGEDDLEESARFYKEDNAQGPVVSFDAADLDARFAASISESVRRQEALREERRKLREGRDG